MDANIIEPIMAICATIALGTFTLIGMKMRYQHKARMMEQPKNSENMERLADAMDSVYEQTRALRDDVSELQERLDFHERLLSEAKKTEGQ